MKKGELVSEERQALIDLLTTEYGVIDISDLEERLFEFDKIDISQFV